MGQKYRFRSLELAELAEKEDAKKEINKDNDNSLMVYEIGETRTINFILKDGTQQNFPYSHYLTAWIGKDGNEVVIKIFFATHLVTIGGYCLDGLYGHLTAQSLKTVKAHDGRYVDTVEEDQPFVTEIKIAWKREQEIA